MIQQLVQRLVSLGAGAVTTEQAATQVLLADPMDLVLHMEQIWQAAAPWGPNTTAPPVTTGPTTSKAKGIRESLWELGAFSDSAPPRSSPPAWDHLIYAFALENTRAYQILRKVVKEFRAGESLGVPSVSTQRWLDATEGLLFNAANLFPAWLSTSDVRRSSEQVRRNLYWRVLGMDLAFGDEDNKPFIYDKASAANSSFVKLFEELLYEVWQAITNTRNTSGVNAADDDRIYRLAEQLTFILRSRRQNQLLAREELAATTVLGWAELTLSTNTPLVTDLRAQATNAADRLRIIGERVGIPAHTRSGSFFAMASDLSLFLRTLEAGFVTGPQFAWLFYAEAAPAPLPAGATLLTSSARRIITEWSAATGRDLKQRALDVRVAPQLPALTR